MVDIIPSLAVIDGKYVRIKNGDYTKVEQLNKSLLDVAKSLEDHGIERIHLIDLQGAQKHVVCNYDTLELIAGHTSLKVDLGGGVNTDGDVHKAFEYGADRVVVGNLSLTNEELFSSWLISYGRNRIILSANVEGETVIHSGVNKVVGKNIMDHIEQYYDQSLQYVKCTDLYKDGTLDSPSIELYKEILQRFPKLKLQASGGVRSIKDIEDLAAIGVDSVIVGRALQDDLISLSELEQFMSRQA
ncbi:HisA/HisF-related TIM barrel protein [Algivirga pacifica]|uniref:1-(5-phosphoribosyl)-5-[(5-phosphoribosylamino) me thylideneamino]imidazole-4-carboxamide isomerase n=1 Tax=Algivirga pacifica TaxID=1162670 RepID=A0ABP9DM25_9BACT